MDNVSIHHVEEVTDLIKVQAGAAICHLNYSPHLNTVEVASQKHNETK